MGRPIKGDNALNNEIKIRVSDKTLAAIDEHAAKYNCTRAEAVRAIIDGVSLIMALGSQK